MRWDPLSSKLQIQEIDKLAFDIAFQQSNLLYRSDSSRIITDPEIKTALLTKFARLAKTEFSLSGNTLRTLQRSEQENLFPFPHTDIEIYNRRAYISSKSGISKASCSKHNKNALSSRIVKIWDAPSLDIAASYGNLAIAAGSEGLYEVEIEATDYAETNRFDEPNQIVQQHTTQVDWNYYSVMGSSHISGGVLAIQKPMFSDTTEHTIAANNDSFSGRIIDATQLFGNRGYTWGSKDKIYQISGNEIHALKFNPFADESEEELSTIPEIRLPSIGSSVVSAKVASFGTIIELDDELLVMQSDNTIFRILGEPVQWRIFSRSKHYENQLHVIYNDRLEIYSFNHDAFINQKNKISGYASSIK